MSLTVPNTGVVSFSTLGSIYGLSPPYKLSQLKRGGSFVPDISENINIKTVESSMKISDYRNSTIQYTITLPTGNIENYNLLTNFTTKFGTFSVTRKYTKVIIPSGTTIGSTTTTAAFNIGQFPNGTSLIIENNGNIYGSSGIGGTSGVGNSGGDAINANITGCSIILYNNSEGKIYGGGGGGGKGGTSGAGGIGGLSKSYGTFEQYASKKYMWGIGEKTPYGGYDYTILIYYNNVLIYQSPSYPGTTQAKNVTQVTVAGYGTFNRGSTFINYLGYDNKQVHTSYVLLDNNVTTILGGTGGAALAGTNGGNGQGYSNPTATSGVTFSFNAGSGNGGRGGYNGIGGTGGNWGIAGYIGGNGEDGLGGSNGYDVTTKTYNNGSAANNSMRTNGFEGGLPGRAILDNQGLTIINQGSILGSVSVNSPTITSSQPVNIVKNTFNNSYSTSYTFTAIASTGTISWSIVPTTYGTINSSSGVLNILFNQNTLVSGTFTVTATDSNSSSSQSWNYNINNYAPTITSINPANIVADTSFNIFSTSYTFQGTASTGSILWSINPTDYGIIDPISGVLTIEFPIETNDLGTFTVTATDANAYVTQSWNYSVVGVPVIYQTGYLIRRQSTLSLSNGITSLDIFNTNYNTTSYDNIAYVNNYTLINTNNQRYEYTGLFSVAETGIYSLGIVAVNAGDLAIFIDVQWVLISNCYNYTSLPASPPNPGTVSLIGNILYPIRIRYYQYNSSPQLNLYYATGEISGAVWTSIPFSRFRVPTDSPITISTIKKYNFPNPSNSFAAVGDPQITFIPSNISQNTKYAPYSISYQFTGISNLGAINWSIFPTTYGNINETTGYLSLNFSQAIDISGSFTVQATNFSAKTIVYWDYILSNYVPGEQIFTTSQSWTVPSLVNSISIVTVGGGASGAGLQFGTDPWDTYAGGGSGGALAYINNINVTPGSIITITVGSGGVGTTTRGNNGGDSFVTINSIIVVRAGGGTGGSQSTVPGGTVITGTGGNGGAAGVWSGSQGGGGGAGGYSGAGGNGRISSAGPTAGTGGGGGGGDAWYGNTTYNAAFGGGVSLFGQGANGAAGNQSNGGVGSFVSGQSEYGAGGSASSGRSSNGGPGAVRIIWPGTVRTFPTTSVGPS